MREEKFEVQPLDKKWHLRYNCNCELFARNAVGDD